MTGIGGVVLDMEGVLHVDWQPLPGAAAAVHELRDGGLELAILTNTTGRTRQEIAGRLGGMGMDFPPERIVTAAFAAAEHLRAAHPGAAVYPLVEAGAVSDLAGQTLVDDPAGAD